MLIVCLVPVKPPRMHQRRVPRCHCTYSFIVPNETQVSPSSENLDAMSKDLQMEDSFRTQFSDNIYHVLTPICFKKYFRIPKSSDIWSERYKGCPAQVQPQWPLFFIARDGTPSGWMKFQLERKIVVPRVRTVQRTVPTSSAQADLDTHCPHLIGSCMRGKDGQRRTLFHYLTSSNTGVTSGR